MSWKIRRSRVCSDTKKTREVEVANSSASITELQKKTVWHPRMEFHTKRGNSLTGLSKKKRIARMLRGHFSNYLSMIVRPLLTWKKYIDFRALKDRISRFHSKEDAWISKKPRKMGHTLNPKTCIKKAKKEQDQPRGSFGALDTGINLLRY
jgi:hypothetical protein